MVTRTPTMVRSPGAAPPYFMTASRPSLRPRTQPAGSTPPPTCSPTSAFSTSYPVTWSLKARLAAVSRME
jgi:hypothetical protein